jgi:hypothetical protein
LAGNSQLQVGGASKPKHFGQSGQPIPLPVTLTKPPSTNNKKTDEQAAMPVRLKNFSLNIRFSADKA